MRKIIFCLVSVIPIFCNSQPLLGVGELKLGKSFVDIQNSLKLNLFIINSDKDKHKELRKDKLILSSMPFDFELAKYASPIFRIDKLDDPFGLSQKEIFSTFDTVESQQLYFLPKYTIASLELNDIYLLFRNDKLVFIDLRNSIDLLNALKKKYPPIKDIDKADTVKCTYTFTGAETENFGFSQNVIWKSNYSYCEYLFDKYFTSDCKPDYLSFFRFYDLAFYNEEQKYKLKEIDKMVNKQKEKNKTLLDSL